MQKSSLLAASSEIVRSHEYTAHFAKCSYNEMSPPLDETIFAPSDIFKMVFDINLRVIKELTEISHTSDMGGRP